MFIVNIADMLRPFRTTLMELQTNNITSSKVYGKLQTLLMKLSALKVLRYYCPQIISQIMRFHFSQNSLIHIRMRLLKVLKRGCTQDSTKYCAMKQANSMLII